MTRLWKRCSRASWCLVAAAAILAIVSEAAVVLVEGEGAGTGGSTAVG